jgi:hypothetical protein
VEEEVVEHGSDALNKNRVTEDVVNVLRNERQRQNRLVAHNVVEASDHRDVPKVHLHLLPLLRRQLRPVSPLPLFLLLLYLGHVLHTHTILVACHLQPIVFHCFDNVHL